ncbi:MAG: calcium-binding protein, partial [Hormoscilla sp. GM102CHS1]|nr:calcium-binding protein [Hormoscilla sp. GM102CHS1]
MKDIIHGYGGDDILRGYAGDDILRGYAGNDILRGYAGNDILYGGAGYNSLNGGAGADIFVLIPGGRATIDFEDGTDSIQLEGGLSFADLTIYGNSMGWAIITVTASGERLVN